MNVIKTNIDSSLSLACLEMLVVISLKALASESLKRK